MERVNFYEVESKCDVCELAEKCEPVYGCWTDDQKMEFNIHFKKLTMENPITSVLRTC